MAEIRLTEGTIRFQDDWLTADDIKARIKEKMDAGDMKFAELAAALEELNQAMERAHRIEVHLVLTKPDYEKLRKRGGDDDNESVRKAVLAFIGGAAPKPSALKENAAPAAAKESAPPAAEKESAPPAAAKESAPPAKEDTAPAASPSAKPAATRIVSCGKCDRKLEIPEGEAPAELECDFCGTSILLKEEETDAPPEPEPKPETKAKEKPDELNDSGIRHKDHFIG